MPAGLWGLHVVFGDQGRSAHARFTCRCGYDASEWSSLKLVELFVEQTPAAHRSVCRLVQVNPGPA